MPARSEAPPTIIQLLVIRALRVVDFFQYQLQQLPHELFKAKQKASTLQIKVRICRLDCNACRGACVLQGFRIHAHAKTENVLFIHFHFCFSGFNRNVNGLDVNTAVIVKD